jgi:hypothetical protein
MVMFGLVGFGSCVVLSLLIIYLYLCFINLYYYLFIFVVYSFIFNSIRNLFVLLRPRGNNI